MSEEMDRPCDDCGAQPGEVCRVDCLALVEAAEIPAPTGQSGAGTETIRKQLVAAFRRAYAEDEGDIFEVQADAALRVFAPDVAFAEIDRLRAACDLIEVRLRRLHHSYGARCHHCKTSWPCATEQTLRAVIREAAAR